MKIIYHSEQDATEFDKARYLKSLNKYGEVSSEQVDKALEEFINNDVLHYSVLIEKAIQLLPDEDSKKEYWNDHQIDNENFERLRRITGYLVGSLERWNDAKKAEEKARVKHSVSRQYNKDEKDYIEVLKYENSVMSQF